MYNKEGVARCHADRQPTERPTRARGTRERQTDVNCQFYSLLSPMLRFPIPGYIAVIHYLSFLQLYVFFYTREISNLEKKRIHLPRKIEREREREGCKRPIRYPIRGPRMPSTSLTARQTPDRRLE